jgi:hypothetical protein
MLDFNVSFGILIQLWQIRLSAEVKKVIRSFRYIGHALNFHGRRRIEKIRSAMLHVVPTPY